MFYCDTAHPVALDSNDHVYPRSTKNDNHANPRFNLRLVDLLGHNPVSVLDIGCAGGGMVKSFLNGGHIAVGIEGSDWSKNAKRQHWDTIPDNLFTADATKPFTVHTGDGRPYQFDAVTAWEFFEHIKEDALQGVIDNIVRHLPRGGWLFASIAQSQVKFLGDVVYHHTLKPAEWWIDLFRRNGIRQHAGTVKFFDDAWVRSGPVKIAAVKQ